MSTALGRRKQSGVDKREALHPLQDYVNARGAQAVPLFRSICRTSCHCFLVLCKLNGKANPCSKTLALMSNNRRCSPGKNPPSKPRGEAAFMRLAPGLSGLLLFLVES